MGEMLVAPGITIGSPPFCPEEWQNPFDAFIEMKRVCHQVNEARAALAELGYRTESVSIKQEVPEVCSIDGSILRVSVRITKKECTPRFLRLPEPKSDIIRIAERLAWEALMSPLPMPEPIL